MIFKFKNHLKIFAVDFLLFLSAQVLVHPPKLYCQERFPFLLYPTYKLFLNFYPPMLLTPNFTRHERVSERKDTVF